METQNNTATKTTDERVAEGNALIERLAGKMDIVTIGRLCEIHAVCPAKWDRFKDGAKANMPKLTDADIDAIVAYVEG